VGIYDGHGFLLDHGSYTTLDVPGLFNATSATGINASGQIVGYYSGGFGSSLHGFLLDQGTYTSLDVPGSYSTYASGINDSGQIVGGYDGGAANRGHGFLLDNGSYTTLDVPGSIGTGASGINASGQIVGSYSDAAGIPTASCSIMAATPRSTCPARPIRMPPGSMLPVRSWDITTMLRTNPMAFSWIRAPTPRSTCPARSGPVPAGSTTRAKSWEVTTTQAAATAFSPRPCPNPPLYLLVAGRRFACWVGVAAKTGGRQALPPAVSTKGGLKGLKKRGERLSRGVKGVRTLF
jgi:probable HAF family extracellular repeat protein